MKIRNFVFATVGAASLALALSACGEAPAGNNSNAKPMNTSTPMNTATPANLTPPTNSTAPSNMNKPSNSTAPTNMTKPTNGGGSNMAKPAPTK